MSDTVDDDLQTRIDQAVQLVREVSMQTDPQEMVRRYRDRVARMRPTDATISLSRRDLSAPQFRVTRDSRWEEDVNPWTQKDRLPLVCGGLLSDLIYGNQPRVIPDLRLDPGDPGAALMDGMRSLLALPLYDRGESLNMVVLLRKPSHAFETDGVPDLLITANLFGRATHNLVMAQQVREAYQALDAEFETIARIQRSLLPLAVRCADGLDVAAHYVTARRAGGDYYDVFPLQGNRSGVLIADVSGHGAAAAVVMARMHAALHSGTADLLQPARVLSFANEQLLMGCAQEMQVLTFVTSFYGVYDPGEVTLTYASAGHNPPRWKRADGGMCSISGARSLPLGIQCAVPFEQDRLRLTAGDEILLYTDGIVEAAAPDGSQFGVDRLDDVVTHPHESAQDLVQRIVQAVQRFSHGASPVDDQTLLALRVC